MKKKYLWLFLLIIPIFLGAWLFIPHGSEGEISDHDQFDAGYELLQSKDGLAEVSVKFPTFEQIEITQISHDGKRLFITIKSNNNELNKNVVEKKEIYLSAGKDEISPDVLECNENKIVFIINNFMSVNEKERYHLELRHLNASIVSEEFEIKLSEPVELTPEKTYEELNISSAKLAGNTLQISGTITAKVDVNSLQIEQGRDWISNAFTLEKDRLSEGKTTFTAAFSIKDNSKLKFNLIVNNKEGTIVSIIPFSLKGG